MSYAVMRTFYNRTAFQLPGDARVRISLDTELSMIREDNWDGRKRTGENWRRTDISIDFPFDQVVPEDIERFKYGVLEVKLQTQFGQEPPKWVTDLVQSHLVEAVPKFSKFIHGCATLLPNRVDLIPFWLPQMDADILKPNTGYLTVERPAVPSSRTTPGTKSSGAVSPSHAYLEPVSDGEEDENMDLTPARDEDKRTGLPTQEVADAVAFRERSLKERERSSRPALNVNTDYGSTSNGDADDRTPYLRQRKSSKVQVPNGRADDGSPISIDPLAPSSAFDQKLKERLQGAQVDGGRQGNGTGPLDADEDVPSDEERLLVRDWTAPSGKKIVVPVRIEPKVYFANERTFLKWLNFAVLIGTIATTLLNFIPANDKKGLISAFLFTLSALLAIAYSAIIFVYRALRLRSRSASGLYYDRYGPTMLCFVLLAALATNIGLRASEL